MKKLLAIYFSGTGNTAYAVKRLCARLTEAGLECVTRSIEDEISGGDMAAADTVLIGYPIYGSDMPRMLKEFLSARAAEFEGKDIITLATQLKGSGDGGALAMRLLKRVGIKRAASIHINLPSNISDFPLISRFWIFKIKNGEQLARKAARANRKIDKCAAGILSGRRVKHGRRFFSRPLGLFQRIPYRLFIEKRYARKLKIDGQLCNKCGLCAECCPADNISGGIVPQNNCNLCYRCINMCHAKAISLVTKRKPKVQYKGIQSDDN